MRVRTQADSQGQQNGNLQQTYSVQNAERGRFSSSLARLTWYALPPSQTSAAAARNDACLSEEVNWAQSTRADWLLLQAVFASKTEPASSAQIVQDILQRHSWPFGFYWEISHLD